MSFFLVRVVGVEPTRIASQEPKSCASANSAIPADVVLSYHSCAPESITARFSPELKIRFRRCLCSALLFAIIKGTCSVALCFRYVYEVMLYQTDLFFRPSVPSSGRAHLPGAYFRMRPMFPLEPFSPRRLCGHSLWARYAALVGGRLPPSAGFPPGISRYLAALFRSGRKL